MISSSWHLASWKLCIACLPKFAPANQNGKENAAKSGPALIRAPLVQMKMKTFHATAKEAMEREPPGPSGRIVTEREAKLLSIFTLPFL
mmetsp:Transcript_10327/g.21106  ORF Transcript_10327/g.21106 Transcript_10327/m.21106 type:complete len:89 (+) Transcript_10327:582-848(+)